MPGTRFDYILTLALLTWRIWWAPNNAKKWQIGFNPAFRGLILNLNKQGKNTWTLMF